MNPPLSIAAISNSFMQDGDVTGRHQLNREVVPDTVGSPDDTDYWHLQVFFDIQAWTPPESHFA